MNFKDVLKTAGTANVSVTINALDLKEIFKECIKEFADEVRQKTLQEKQTEKYLTVREASEVLKVSIPTLYRWQHINYLLPIKVGNQPRYKQSDIDRIMEGRRLN